MTEIPNPVYRVLELADPGEIDQPKPPEDVNAFSDIGVVPVAEACERCGCHWIGDPSAFIPDGNAECAYCRLWRGSVHRDASLQEFTGDDGDQPDLHGDDDEPQGGTIDSRMTEGIPIYDADAMGLDDAIGLVDTFEAEEDGDG